MIDPLSYLLGAASVILAQILWAAGDMAKWVGRLLRWRWLKGMGALLMWIALFVLIGYYVYESIAALWRFVQRVTI